jgi:glycosyltransferase involved in cell wall biosynthesis
VKNRKGAPLRLAVVLSHPTQYYSPWFQSLRAHTDVEFRVFYLWDFGIVKQEDPFFGVEVKWDVDLLSGYESEFVPNESKRPGAEHFSGFRNPTLPARLESWNPDALLLFGYKWASHLRAVAWARMHGVPILFRGDSHLIGRPDPGLRMSLPLRLLFAQFAAFLYVGSANREYFERFGVPARKLFLAPHSVNATLFERGIPANRDGASVLRLQLGLKPTTKVMLFAGKLVPGKQPVELLRVFQELSPIDTALVFVGDGSEREKLQAMAAYASGTAGNALIRFLPFANQSEMPSRYTLADIFVLPSRADTWGLAINEAMHMGVPCIVSNRVGCQRDLVTDGETGWVFDAADPSALKNCLSRALSDISSGARRGEIQGAVLRRIAGYTYAQTTEGLLKALASLQP